MRFTETKLKGAFIIDIEPHEDERGFFARTFCVDEFQSRGLNGRLLQCSVSQNKRRGTLRGLHWQESPNAEAKLVRATRGAVYDVIVDLRRNSPTFRQWVGVELTPVNHRQVYVPEGFAHGFQTLEDDTEVFYQMSALYTPTLAKGVRWNDPAFEIEWPRTPERIMNERDRSYPDYE